MCWDRKSEGRSITGMGRIVMKCRSVTGREKRRGEAGCTDVGSYVMGSTGEEEKQVERWKGVRREVGEYE